MEVIKDFMTSSWPTVEKYAQGQSEFHRQKAVTFGYIQKRCASVSAFRKDKIGSTNAIKRAIKNLIERGDLQELGRAEVKQKFDSSSICYMISNLRAFGL